MTFILLIKVLVWLDQVLNTLIFEIISIHSLLGILFMQTSLWIFGFIFLIIESWAQKFRMHIFKILELLLNFIMDIVIDLGEQLRVRFDPAWTDWIVHLVLYKNRSGLLYHWRIIPNVTNEFILFLIIGIIRALHIFEFYQLQISLWRESFMLEISFYRSLVLA